VAGFPAEPPATARARLTDQGAPAGVQEEPGREELLDVGLRAGAGRQLNDGHGASGARMGGEPYWSTCVRIHAATSAGSDSMVSSDSFVST